jgi:hypothetical protein
MEHCYGPLALELVPGKQEGTAISAPILPRERELSLAHAQKCSFLINEECWPLAVEMIPGKHCVSAHILRRVRELSLAHAQRSIFLIMEQICGPLAIELIPGKHSDLSTKLTKRARAQFGTCAVVQFPDNGTELWSPGSKIGSRKTLRFQHLYFQETESSVFRMRRGEIS